jgi:glycosyltransferase involved in cell wall biosynthesis
MTCQPTFSVVTISFNQAEFLERALRSVLEQNYPSIEYIVIDSGSTDGSREIIEGYRSKLTHVIFEPDRGPADGLNKGFAHASGGVYCYLNSDDAFEAEAFHRVATAFSERPNVDVFCGHAWVTDAQDRKLRRVWSDPYNRISQAYGTATQVQPSTFIRQVAFLKSGGFNSENRWSWDWELIVALAQSGARIEILDEVLSQYRLHLKSITNSGYPPDVGLALKHRHFRILMGRDWRRSDEIIFWYWRIRRQLRNPRAALERVLYGPVAGRGPSINRLSLRSRLKTSRTLMPRG